MFEYNLCVCKLKEEEHEGLNFWSPGVSIKITVA